MDKRRYGVIEVRQINAEMYWLEINGEMWSEVEWSRQRRAWCIQDAAGHCLSHVEHIVGQDRDPQTAIRLAKRMIVDGRMPAPEEAHAQLEAERDRAQLGEPIIGDITAGSQAVLVTGLEPPPAKPRVKSKYRWPCDGCGGDWLENPGPMFHNHVWKRISTDPRERLCATCVRSRFEYRLADLTDCPHNDPWLNPSRSYEQWLVGAGLKP